MGGESVPVDEGAVAFAVAAKVLPRRVKEALDAQDLRALRDAMDAQERCYKIFPELRPKELDEVIPAAATAIESLHQQALDGLRESLCTLVGDRNKVVGPSLLLEHGRFL